MMSGMVWNGWLPILDTAILAVCAYGSLLVLQFMLSWLSVIAKRPPGDAGILEGVATPRLDAEDIGFERSRDESG